MMKIYRNPCDDDGILIDRPNPSGSTELNLGNAPTTVKRLSRSAEDDNPIEITSYHNGIRTSVRLSLDEAREVAKAIKALDAEK